MELTLCILNDLKKVYPVSNYNTNYDVYLSTPCIIGKNGIEKVINIKLTDEEEEKLEEASEVLVKHLIRYYQKNCIRRY